MAGRGQAHVWATLALCLASLAAVTVTTVTGAEATDVLTVIATVIVPTTSILLVGQHIAGRVSAVHKEVNGRMGRLIEKIPDPPDGG